jgi:hypothetical protein
VAKGHVVIDDGKGVYTRAIRLHIEDIVEFPGCSED